MTDDTRPQPSGERTDEGTPLTPAATDRLQEEVTRLRLQLADEIRTRRVVIVDDSGFGRIRLSTDEHGGCNVTLLDPDGFERAVLSGASDGGSLRIAARSHGDGPARVDLFALDPEDDAGSYVGLELLDAGTSVAGFTVIETRSPRTWSA
jgi:hypothetical protein